MDAALVKADAASTPIEGAAAVAELAVAVKSAVDNNQALGPLCRLASRNAATALSTADKAEGADASHYATAFDNVINVFFTIRLSKQDQFVNKGFSLKILHNLLDDTPQSVPQAEKERRATVLLNAVGALIHPDHVKIADGAALPAAVIANNGVAVDDDEKRLLNDAFSQHVLFAPAASVGAFAWSVIKAHNGNDSSVAFVKSSIATLKGKNAIEEALIAKASADAGENFELSWSLKSAFGPKGSTAGNYKMLFAHVKNLSANPTTEIDNLVAWAQKAAREQHREKPSVESAEFYGILLDIFDRVDAANVAVDSPLRVQLYTMLASTLDKVDLSYDLAPLQQRTQNLIAKHYLEGEKNIETDISLPILPKMSSLALRWPGLMEKKKKREAAPENKEGDEAPKTEEPAKEEEKAAPAETKVEEEKEKPAAEAAPALSEESAKIAALIESSTPAAFEKAVTVAKLTTYLNELKVEIPAGSKKADLAKLALEAKPAAAAPAAAPEAEEKVETEEAKPAEAAPDAEGDAAPAAEAPEAATDAVKEEPKEKRLSRVLTFDARFGPAFERDLPKLLVAETRYAEGIAAAKKSDASEEDKAKLKTLQTQQQVVRECIRAMELALSKPLTFRDTHNHGHGHGNRHGGGHRNQKNGGGNNQRQNNGGNNQRHQGGGGNRNNNNNQNNGNRGGNQGGGGGDRKRGREHDGGYDRDRDRGHRHHGGGGRHHGGGGGHRHGGYGRR